MVRQTDRRHNSHEQVTGHKTGYKFRYYESPVTVLPHLHMRTHNMFRYWLIMSSFEMFWLCSMYDSHWFPVQWFPNCLSAFQIRLHTWLQLEFNCLWSSSFIPTPGPHFDYLHPWPASFSRRCYIGVRFDSIQFRHSPINFQYINM